MFKVDKAREISFPTTGTPLDIAGDPTSGDFLILFNDNTAMRCLRDSFYRQYSIINLPGYMPLTKISCAPNGYWFVGRI